jgi:hypothetical protein
MLATIYLTFKVIFGLSALGFSFASLYMPTFYKLKGKKPGVILVHSIKAKKNSYILLAGMTIILLTNQFALFSSILISLVFYYKGLVNKKNSANVTA